MQPKITVMTSGEHGLVKRISGLLLMFALLLAAATPPAMAASVPVVPPPDVPPPDDPVIISEPGIMPPLHGLQSISATPGNLTLIAGNSQQLKVTATNDDGTTRDVTQYAIYQSSNTSVAKVSINGLVNAVAPGNAVITITYESCLVTTDDKGNPAKTCKTLSCQVPVTVTERTLTGITVSPSFVNLQKGGTQQLAVTANYSDGTTRDVTQDMTSSGAYSSSNTSVATVSASGLVTAVGVGSATITVSYGGITAEVPVKVAALQLIDKVTVNGKNPDKVDNSRQVWYTNNDLISIEISFTDNVTQISYDPGSGSLLKWDGSVTGTNTKLEGVVLSKGSGTNRVRIEASNGVNVDARELLVVVDQSPPTILNLRGFNGATATTGTKVTLEINAVDNIPGQLYYQYQINGGAPSSWQELTGSTIDVSGLSPGANSITVNVKDLAGNVSSFTRTIFRI